MFSKLKADFVSYLIRLRKYKKLTLFYNLLILLSLNYLREVLSAPL